MPRCFSRRMARSSEWLDEVQGDLPISSANRLRLNSMIRESMCPLRIYHPRPSRVWNETRPSASLRLSVLECARDMSRLRGSVVHRSVRGASPSDAMERAG